MRIGLNFRIGNLSVFDGNSAVMRSIARSLGLYSSDHSVDLIVDSEPALALPYGSNATFHMIRPFPILNRVLRRLLGGDPWYRLRLPLDRRWRALDAYICNAHEEPPVISGPPRIPIVHDLAFMLDDAERFFSREHIEYLDWCTAANVHASSRIIAVSETTARDIVRIYGVPAEQVCVLLNAHDADIFNPDIDAQTVQRTLVEYEINRPFFLHVGTIQPRKNISTILRAFDAFLAAGGKHQLVLVGSQGWSGEKRAESDLSNVTSMKNVHPLGSLDTEQIACLMTSADALVMAGFYEGFGLPALESMACGTPVLAANAGALPEVVGNGGILFDPTDSDTLVEAMNVIDSDSSRKSLLRQRALARASEFSWETHAKGLIQLVEELV